MQSPRTLECVSVLRMRQGETIINMHTSITKQNWCFFYPNLWTIVEYSIVFEKKTKRKTPLIRPIKNKKKTRKSLSNKSNENESNT